MGERISTTNRGQSSPHMSVINPSSLMIFYISMNVACTGLGVRVSTTSMMVFYNSMNLTCAGLGVRVPTSSRVSTPSMVIFHNSM